MIRTTTAMTKATMAIVRVFMRPFLELIRGGAGRADHTWFDGRSPGPLRIDCRAVRGQSLVLDHAASLQRTNGVRLVTG